MSHWTGPIATGPITRRTKMLIRMPTIMLIALDRVIARKLRAVRRRSCDVLAAPTEAADELAIAVMGRVGTSIFLDVVRKRLACQALESVLRSLSGPSGQGPTQLSAAHVQAVPFFPP